MTRIAMLSMVLATTLGAACSKESPQSRGSSLETPTDRATPPKSVSAETDDEGAARWAHKTYPKDTLTETGKLGTGQTGTLVAARGTAKYDLASSWEKGPAVIVFYRGHW